MQTPKFGVQGGSLGLQPSGHPSGVLVGGREWVERSLGVTLGPKCKICDRTPQQTKCGPGLLISGPSLGQGCPGVAGVDKGKESNWSGAHDGCYSSANFTSKLLNSEQVF